MGKTKFSTKRKNLLLELENIVGNECYNGSIQNWGPNGVFLGEGREFRYPVTFKDENQEKIKKRWPDFELPAEMVKTGYYAFGRNELHIVKALDRVLSHLEENYGLNLNKRE